MKTLYAFDSSALRVSALVFAATAVLGLSGCGGVTAFPDSAGATGSAQPGSIQGSVFGGHAPIENAHVYVLQAGNGGYNTASSSLIKSTAAGAAKDTSGNYYVTTAADGSFNVTGDYTCTVGVPVYLAAISGQTTDLIGGANYNTTPISITAASAVFDAISGDTVVTFTGNNLLYPNQQVSFSGLGGTYGGPLNGGTYTLVGVPTTTSFKIAYTGTATLSGTTTGTAQPLSLTNPAIANLATLGTCPSSGNFSTGSTALRYVYINEVSTVATAYAFAGFGSGPFTIGFPAADTLALTGIQNAASNAAQIYNIQGGGPQSITFAGEGHIANSVTPAGNGVVPQSLVDTLGNVLASCVDSTNTLNSASNPDVGGASTSCSKLFTFATSNGIPYGSTGAGTSPTDTATAAFNIAHFPAGNPTYTTTVVPGIFALQNTETTPFAPNLSGAPNDYTIGISYNIGAQPTSVAVDALGNGWLTAVPALGTGEIVEGSPLGVGLYQGPTATYQYGDIVVDSAGNGWTGTYTAYLPATEVLTPANSHLTPAAYSLVHPDTAPFTSAEAAVANGSGDVWFPHGPTNATNNNDQTLSEVNSAGVVNAGTTGNLSFPNYVLGIGGSFGPNAIVSHGAIDSTGAIWFSSYNGNTITRVNSSTGTALAGFPFTQASILSTCGLLNSIALVTPEQVAIDASNNAWVPVNNGNAGTYIVKISPTAGCSDYTVGTGPYGAAIDGAGNVWVTNNASNSLTELNSAGTVISPSTGYLASSTLNGAQELAVDPSGDLIIANYGGSTVVQVIGVATPTYAPLGVAAANGKLGAKP